jgi:hypothetical protein
VFEASPPNEIATQRAPVAIAGSVLRYAHSAFNSVSSRLAKVRGMTGFSSVPSGRFAVRIAFMKSASVHLVSRLSAWVVRFAAGGQSGGPISILPPEKFGPWQPVQPKER